MSTLKEMSFTDHLAELRDCLAKALLAVAICAGFSFVWAQDIFTLLTLPLREAFSIPRFIGTSPAEAFIMKLKVSVVSGVVISSPVIFYQLWKFVTPGLHAKEQRSALPFVVSSTAFFLTGASFCFIVVLPYAFSFFEGEYQSIGVDPYIKIGEYLSFVVRMLVVFGLVFELPVLTYFLARLGLITPVWLIKQGRISIVVIFVLAALLTPPDVATQVLLALPLIVLYGLCIGVAHVVELRKKS